MLSRRTFLAASAVPLLRAFWDAAASLDPAAEKRDDPHAGSKLRAGKTG